MVIIDPGSNSLHIFCNYLFNKICDRFINNEKNVDQNDLIMVKFLNEGKILYKFKFFYSKIYIDF